MYSIRYDIAEFTNLSDFIVKSYYYNSNLTIILISFQIQNYINFIQWVGAIYDGTIVNLNLSINKN